MKMGRPRYLTKLTYLALLYPLLGNASAQNLLSYKTIILHPIHVFTQLDADILEECENFTSGILYVDLYDWDKGDSSELMAYCFNLYNQGLLFFAL